MKYKPNLNNTLIQSKDSPKSDYSLIKDPSAGVLLLTNIIIIFLALIQKWPLLEILRTYWMQSVIIGVFHFFRMLSINDFSTEEVLINGRPVKNPQIVKYSMAFFFLVHYGLFHFVYLVFLFITPGVSASQSIISSSFILGSALFFVNHLFSFLYNSKIDSQKKQNIGKIMSLPYARIIPMHIIIVLGRFLFYNNQFLLFFFLVLKTLSDLIMHANQHKN